MNSSVSGVYGQCGKRIFDFAFSVFALVLFLPIILIIMIVVAIDGGNPLFAHRRVGQFGREFDCLKIRTMRTDAADQLAQLLQNDIDAAAQWAAERKLDNDPRITRVGAFLRRTSLDELPQLLCVLKGEMSIVGPRPVTVDELQLYGASAERYLSVRPGLTGPWQVQGRNDIPYSQRVAIDDRYSREFTFARDLLIVVMTCGVVLRPTGR